MILENIAASDRNLIDSCLGVYHSAKNDTLKFLAINTIVETSWDDHVWPLYNFWIYKEVSRKIPKEKNSKIKITLQKYLAGSLSNIGFYHYQKGNYRPAIEYYNQAFEIQNELSDKQGMASTFNNIALVHQAKGDIDKALDFFNKSLEIKKALNDKTGMALAYNNLADIYSEQGNIPKALEYHHKSLKINEKSGNSLGMANSFVNIAMIHSRQKDYKLALKYDEKALKIYKKAGDKQSISTVYSNIGSIHKGTGDLEKALRYYEKSLLLDEETENKKGMTDTYNKISSIHYSLGNMQKAKEFILKSKNLCEEIGYQKGLAVTYQYLGRIQYESGEIKEGIISCTKGMELARKLGFPEQIRALSGILSLLYAKQGNYKLALEFRNLEIQMKDSIASEEAFRSAAQQEAKYKYEKQFTEDSILNAQEKQLKDAQIAEQNARQLQTDAELKNKRNMQYALFAGVFLLVSFLIFVYNRFRITRSQKEIIEKQKEVVDEKNREILDSIRYAKRIQEAILPSMQSMQKALREGFVLYKPKDVVAGDFYWLEKVDFGSSTSIYLAVADCTGHGVPGAMVSVICSNALSKALLEEKAPSTGILLDKTREIVIERLAKNNDESSVDQIKDGMDISLCTINFNEMKLQWSGANNPLWIVRKSDGKADSSCLMAHGFYLKEIKPDKQPIGIYSHAKPFSTHDIKLEKNDAIYLFTDGYQDQFGGTATGAESDSRPDKMVGQGKKYKTSRLKKLILSIQNESMNRQKEIIDQNFSEWKGSFEQVDDVCIIGIKIQ